MESTQQKPRQRGNSEREPANVYHVQNFGSIDKTFKLTLFLSPMKSVSHCKERNARNLVQLYGPYFDEVAHLLSAMIAFIPVHYARVPPLCMDCAIVSNFPSEKRFWHSAAKIKYADERLFRNVVV